MAAQNGAGADDAEAAALRQAAASPVVQEQKAAALLLAERDGLGLSPIDKLLHPLDLVGRRDGGARQPSLAESRAKGLGARPVGIDLQLGEHLLRNQNPIVELLQEGQ